MNKGIKILLFTFFIFLMAFSLVKAIDSNSEGWKLDPGENFYLDIHNIAKIVTNTGSNTYFVPTKTEPEWSAFINNHPSDVTVEEGVECQLSILTADGGSNQQAYPNVSITLDSGVGDGSSCDPNGYIIAYLWTQTSGTFVSLTNYDSSYWHDDWTSPVPYFPTTFTSPFSPGTLTFELEVWDNDFNSASDEISIVVFGESEPNYGDCSDFDGDVNACICCNPSDWTGNCNNPEGCCGDGQNVPNSDCWYYYGDCMKRGSYGDGTHLCPQ